MRFLFLLLVSFQVSATSIAKYRSVPDGSLLQKFNLDTKSSSYEKTSNFFDPEKKDFGIGIYAPGSAVSDYAAIKKSLEEYAAKFRTVDEFLKTKGSDFNKVSGLVRHEVIIMVDDFRIKPDSKYYAELNKLFQKLQRLKWTLLKGYRLSQDLKTVQEVSDGEVIKTLKYDSGLYCEKASRPTVCTYYGGGKVFVE